MVRETAEEAEARLLKVIASARFEALEGTYAFRELLEGPRELNANALACVRDDRTWSELVPVSATAPRQGQFRMFSFHFAADLDASGFVAWLASHLKRTVGTGVVVICGRDQRGETLHAASQGVFDYWGCPAQFGDRVSVEIGSLRNPDHTGRQSEDRRA